jgi:aminoglycoside phosphotransferase (APT) family kinase protein
MQRNNMPTEEELKIAAGLVSLIADNRSRASNIKISQLMRLHGGNSSEIWSFRADWKEPSGYVARDLILRRGAENEFVSTGRDTEFMLLRALNLTSVLAPEVLFFDNDGRHLERPSMIMERCQGDSDRGLLTENGKLGLNVDTRVNLARQIIDSLCAIHRVDTAAMQFDPEAGRLDPAVRQLNHYDSEISRLESEPMAELRLASWWLRENLPKPPIRRTVIHGDFRPANMLIHCGRLSAVLDWEFAHIGDPVEDLGWYLTPLYAHEHLIPGVWSVEDVLSHYEQAMGMTVDRSALLFWSIFAQYKLASMTMGALKWFLEGDSSRMSASARSILVPLLKSIATTGGAHEGVTS